MTNDAQPSSPSAPSRREFLEATGAATVVAAAASLQRPLLAAPG